MRVLLVVLFFGFSAAFASLPSMKNGRSNTYSTLRNSRGEKSSFALNAEASIIAAESTPSKKGGEASIASSTFNLAKSIIGAGVLSLPSGVAFFADDPAAAIPASIICATMGLLSAYTFSLIGKSCEKHNAQSFQDAWAKSVDPKTAWIISAGITSKCLLASLAYTIIIGDSFTALAKTFNLPSILAQRTNVIVALASLVLLPLCSLKSLSSLAPFSLLGLGGSLYTAVFMAIRYFDGSYAPGGRFFSTMAESLRPSFNKRGGFTLNHLAFVLVSMLSTSFISHYNAPRFYNELKDTSLPRFNKVVGSAFFMSIAMFAFMMSMGFLTFGGSCAGFVLNNYSGSDQLATFARLAIGLALLTGYPFGFSALRDGILDLQGVTGEKRDALVPRYTYGLLALVTSLALVLKDVGFVVSLSGALFGCALMFIVPAIMNICDVKAATTKVGKLLSRGNKVEIGLNYGLIGTGFVMAVLGVSISVLRQLGKL